MPAFPPGPRRPVIAVVADVRWIDGQPFHMAQDKYLTALWTASGAMPIIAPAFGADLDLAELVAGLDGLLLTGCVSNIEPWRYGGPSEPPSEPYDPERDATALPLVGVALAAGLPLLAVCRGFQEVNVALGGTLNPFLHERPGGMDHRAPYGKPLAEQYAPTHEVRFTPGGVLAALAGDDRLMVNSLHWQGIERLADGLSIEATAPDGTIEGIRVTGAKSFALGVQWHPEWEVMATPFSRALFAAFGDAARARQAERQGPQAG
jgi:putative glutamine amidotransferase